MSAPDALRDALRDTPRGTRLDGHGGHAPRAASRRPRLQLRHLSPASAGVDRASLHALAWLLLLVQLPHVLHLPVWTSLLGATIVGARLYALHRPDLRILDRLLSSVSLTLLCLAAFLLLTQYFYSQTILAALVTLPAVLALGNALAVLRDPANAAPASPRLRLVGKLLAQGVPVAVLLFVVFPRLPGPLWSLPEDGTGTTGLSDSMAPGSIGSLSLSDAVAFRVEFDGAPPPPSARYWRGPVLDRFDGREWSAARIDGRGPARVRPAPADGPTLDYAVMLQPHRQRWLFALERPASLPRGSDAPGASGVPLATLTDDGQLLSDDPVVQVMRYRQSSTLSPDLVPARAPGRDQLALAGRNPRTVALAARLRAGHPDDAGYAQALLRKFRREPFRYTLQPSLLGDAPVDEFLFDTREGFCEHYASTFTVAMRAAGIPARVVTGYLGGEMNGDYMIVRQSDAHAWAEAWIDGAWRRYDPTGAVAPSRVESGLGAALPDSSSVPRLARLAGADVAWLRGARLGWDRMNHGWQRLVVDFDDDSQMELWERLGLSAPPLWQIVAGMLAAAGVWCAVVLGAVAPWFPRFGRVRQRPEERAWRALERRLARRGLARGVAETPSAWLSRASRADPVAAAAIEAAGGRDRRFERPAR